MGVSPQSSSQSKHSPYYMGLNRNKRQSSKSRGVYERPYAATSGRARSDSNRVRADRLDVSLAILGGVLLLGAVVGDHYDTLADQVIAVTP